MLELQNMIKHYGNHNGYRGLERLLGQASLQGGNELVLLRIPSAKLNASRLSIRDNGTPSIMPSQFNVADLIGDSAINSKLYKQRKVGLEYIYPHDIDINNVTMVGSAKIKSILDDGLMSDAEALEVWKHLTEGNPEYKAFEILN